VLGSLLQIVITGCVTERIAYRQLDEKSREKIGKGESLEQRVRVRQWFC
jgi:hypothetical protein